MQPEGLGLTLAEAKDLLRGVQETMVAEQVAEFVAQQECCPDCGRPRPRKGRHEIVYRTLFGKLRLDSPRLYACPCQERRPVPAPARWPSGSPSGRPRSWPTWRAKFAALMSYGLTVDLLAEILPLGEELNTTAVRRQVRRRGRTGRGRAGGGAVLTSSRAASATGTSCPAPIRP